MRTCFTRRSSAGVNADGCGVRGHHLIAGHVSETEASLVGSQRGSYSSQGGFGRLFLESNP